MVPSALMRCRILQANAACDLCSWFGVCCCAYCVVTHASEAQQQPLLGSRAGSRGCHSLLTAEVAHLPSFVWYSLTLIVRLGNIFSKSDRCSRIVHLLRSSYGTAWGPRWDSTDEINSTACPSGGPMELPLQLLRARIYTSLFPKRGG
eukprot:GHRQ01022086.1.p1 GENE.GHRQ01022086.1~~GHRQ01022086.1.p1  ORF type:complete len:148 (-),score=3.41 GHRQ01022086.1:224-667(-)